MSPNPSISDRSIEKDIDIFLTLRHLGPSGKEIYSGTAGDPVPFNKGWLRVSLRKVVSDYPKQGTDLSYQE